MNKNSEYEFRIWRTPAIIKHVKYVFNPILLTSVFAADLKWSKSTTNQK